MNFDVFISYSSKDATIANAACAALEAAKIRCWIAPRDIQPGAEWGASIVRAIDHCRVLVLIFSANSNESRQVHREINRAFSKGAAVVPLRIENITPADALAYYLDSVHWLDALTPPLERGLQQLATAVGALLAATTPAATGGEMVLTEVEAARAQEKARAEDKGRDEEAVHADDERRTPQAEAPATADRNGRAEEAQQKGEATAAPENRSGPRTDELSGPIASPAEAVAASHDLLPTRSDGTLGAKEVSIEAMPAESDTRHTPAMASNEVKVFHPSEELSTPIASHANAVAVRDAPLVVASEVAPHRSSADGDGTRATTTAHDDTTPVASDEPTLPEDVLKATEAETGDTAARRPSRRALLIGGVVAGVGALAGASALLLTRGQDRRSSEQAPPPREKTPIISVSAPVRTFTGHTDVVFSVAMVGDGRTALSASADKTLRLWDLTDGSTIRTFTGHKDAVWSVAIAPDGHTALSGSDDKTIRLWDLASGRTIRTFTGHVDKVRTVAIAPDGHTALSAGFDRTLRLWDLANGRTIRTFIGGIVESVAFSPDGRTALSTNGDTLYLWNLADNSAPLRTFHGHSDAATHIAIAPDGRTALSGGWDRTVRLWDMADGRVIRTFVGHTAPVFSVAFLPDGRTALSGGGDEIIRLWDLASGNTIRTFATRGGVVWSIAVASDGRTAMSAHVDPRLKLWDLT